MKRIAALILLTSFFSGMAIAQYGQADHYETVVYATDIWRYFPGTTDPGASWNSLSFDDSSWPEGEGGIGYADNDDNTVISPVISLFMRIHFNVIDTAKIKDVLFHMDYDDGFVAYINGIEAARAGLTGNPPAYDATADNHEAQARHYRRWDILGIDVGAPEHPPIPDTYAGEIDRLKEWIDKRLTWLDANMPGKNITSDIGNSQITSEDILIRIFPNHASDYIYVESGRIIREVDIFNTAGII